MSSVKESGAVALLTRAVQLDNEGRCDEALSCYQSGIEQLMTVMKGLYHSKSYLAEILQEFFKIVTLFSTRTFHKISLLLQIRASH